MFNREVSGLTLTKPVANTLFQNINGVPYRTDVSFLATLRALMYQRVPAGESITLKYNNSMYKEYELQNSSHRDRARAFLKNSGVLSGCTGILNVHSFSGTVAANDMCFQTLDSAEFAEFSGFTPLPDLAKWYEQSGRVRARVFVNAKTKNTLIFIEKLDIKRWHLIQSLIPRYFPWYVSDKPFDKEEVELIRSLTKRYAPEYEEKIEVFAKRFDFRTLAIRTQLRGFETKFEQNKLEGIRRDLAAWRQENDNIMRQFKECYQRIQDLTAQECGLVEKIRRGGNEEDSEFLQYFLCNKNLHLVDVSGGAMTFIVTTVLSNYDPDLFESIIAKFGSSFFYRHWQNETPYENKEMTDERIRLLMNAVFRDELLKIRVCAAYYLDFSSGHYQGRKGYSFPAEILAENTPNQHIQYYACLGNNQGYIAEAMMNRDYVAAVNYCCSSASNINFSEPNTGTFFMQKICANNVGKIIQMPDGSNMTPLDAVKWLEAQNEEKRKAKEETNEQTD